eukprot:5223856-Pyramimonas_sp.AAC.1
MTPSSPPAPARQLLEPPPGGARGRWSCRRARRAPGPPTARVQGGGPPGVGQNGQGWHERWPPR